MVAIWEEVKGEDLVVDGCIVPHIQVIDTQEESVLTLVIDNRIHVDFSRAEFKKYTWFLANAMAVAAGYTCHGLDSKPINLYKRPHPDYIFGDEDEN